MTNQLEESRINHKIVKRVYFGHLKMGDNYCVTIHSYCIFQRRITQNFEIGMTNVSKIEIFKIVLNYPYYYSYCYRCDVYLYRGSRLFDPIYRLHTTQHLRCKHF